MGTDRDTKLCVTHIERFATHDGPGIRTVVFFKGCPLHCPWCANPETQDFRPQLLYDVKKCVGCRACEQVCPTGAIYFRGLGEGAGVCTLCSQCEEACPQGAIEFVGDVMTVGEVLAEVERDKEYYGGDGGLTASGGEPFAQQEGLLAMLRESRRLGIGTAVETTGNTPGEALWAAEPFVDHFLYDFKHVDDGVLRGVTGGDGKRIKENLAWLLGHCPQKVTVRIPVIPGFNAASGGAGAGGADAGGTDAGGTDAGGAGAGGADAGGTDAGGAGAGGAGAGGAGAGGADAGGTDADGTGTTGTGAGKTGAGGAGTTGEGDGPVLVQMLRYLHSIGAKRVSLLPYHTLGKEKYQKLGREYTWGCGGVASAAASAADQLSPSDLVSDVAPLREEDLAWALQLAQGLGLTADVGG